MTVYVYPIVKSTQGQDWTHLAADTLDELHAFAEQIDIAPTWFYEESGATEAHYKLSIYNRKTAIERGAVELVTKILYVLRGHSGSGKSTLANKITQKTSVYASDKYPKAYDEKGNYQASEQAAAHKWCKEQIAGAIARGDHEIVFANTNMKTEYFEGIVEQAKAAGYTIQLILCEELFGPDGKRLPNAYKTPTAVIEHQINGFQPLNSPSPGVTIEETLKANSTIMGYLMKGETPPIIACDLVNTLVIPNGNTTFNKASQLKLNEPVIRQLKTLGYGRLTICSNQMGVGYGHMSIDDLAEIADVTQANLEAHNFHVDRMLFATKRNSPVCWVYEDGAMTEIELASNADKPNYGMLEFLSSLNPEAKSGVYIGDAHHTSRAEDIETIRRAAKADTDIANRFTYIPVEVLEYLNA